MRALITGGGGQLASDLSELLGDGAVALPRQELDITSVEEVRAAVASTRPEVVINCAALHNLDACEREPEQAFATNVLAVANLARTGVPLVHLSTNYVFDGRREEPYREEDLPRPRSVYALSKLAGEHVALAYGSRSLVIRTAGLYGPRGNASKGGNFVQRMLARAREQGSLRVVADQRLQPTFTADLARAVAEAIDRQATGIIHLVAGGACSWFEFTTAIMELAGLDVPVEPVSTSIAPGQPDRPLNGVLARPRADGFGLTPLRPWREELVDYMHRAGYAASAVTS